MSGFKPYPAYKDSGVEWLGEVPEYWGVFSLKRSLDGCVNGIWGAEADGIDDLAVIRVADFDRQRFRVGLDKLTYRSIPANDRVSRTLQPGDLLIEKSGGGEKTLVGCVVLFEHDFPAVSSNFVGRMRPQKGFDSGFLCYVFCSLYDRRLNYPAIKQTTGIQNLDVEAYLQGFFASPPSSEQTQIARFLDHETARIDALIAEQERLIELLKEKRQAVISHAVTKGLNPDVPMKDSGVEWLGQVPAHWEVVPVKYLTETLDQGWSPQCEEYPVASDTEWGVLKVGCVNGGHFNAQENKRLPDHLEPESKLTLKKNDVLISRANTRELVGSTAIVERSYPNLMLCDKLYRIRLLADRALPYWLTLFLNSQVARHQIELGATGASSSMLNISQSTITELPVPLPTMAEQADLCEKVRARLTELSLLIGTVMASIDLLRERRSALISAAVTGKIDVRDWRPPADAPSLSEAA